MTISVISENLSPAYRMVLEKFSFKNWKFYKECIWLINSFATQQFRSFRWLIFPSMLLTQIAQVNQLFQLLNFWVKAYANEKKCKQWREQRFAHKQCKKKKMGCEKYKPLNLNWIIILLVYKSELFLICIKMCQAFLLIIRTF